jgi:hypothetical protein
VRQRLAVRSHHLNDYNTPSLAARAAVHGNFVDLIDQTAPRGGRY